MSENFVFWEKYKKFYIYVEKSFLGRISLVGCLRLVHFRLLLPHLPHAYSWECCRHETMNFTWVYTILKTLKNHRNIRANISSYWTISSKLPKLVWVYFMNFKQLPKKCKFWNAFYIKMLVTRMIFNIFLVLRKKVDED